jgi:hemerythrin
MNIAQWDDSFKTGDGVVDSQHQELFRMVNELHNAIIANKGKEILGPTLDKLAKYTIEHFQTEEGLMERIKYPSLSTHQQKHKDLTDEVVDLVGKFKAGQMVLSITLSNFLAKWLRHHIKEDDVALVNFSKASSTSAARV